MAAVGLSTRAVRAGGRGGISILSQLLHPLAASSRCLPDFFLHPRLVFDRHFVVREKLEVGFLGRANLLQQNPKCSSSGGICGAGDGREKGHLSLDQPCRCSRPPPRARGCARCSFPLGSREAPAEQRLCVAGLRMPGTSPHRDRPYAGAAFAAFPAEHRHLLSPFCPTPYLSA